MTFAAFSTRRFRCTRYDGRRNKITGLSGNNAASSAVTLSSRSTGSISPKRLACPDLIADVHVDPLNAPRGMVDDAKALLDNSGADLWVVQKDTLAPMPNRRVYTMTYTAAYSACQVQQSPSSLCACARSGPPDGLVVSRDAARAPPSFTPQGWDYRCTSELLVVRLPNTNIFSSSIGFSLALTFSDSIRYTCTLVPYTEERYLSTCCFDKARS